LVIAISYTLLITTLSLVQLGKISVGSFSPTDKMMHAGAYFGLAFCWLFYLFIKKQEPYNYKKGFVKVCGLVVLFGMLIEVLQGALTTFRQADWADIVANTIGVMIALGFFILFRNFLTHLKRQISSFL